MGACGAPGPPAGSERTSCSVARRGSRLSISTDSARANRLAHPHGPCGRSQRRGRNAPCLPGSGPPGRACRAHGAPPSGLFPGGHTFAWPAERHPPPRQERRLVGWGVKDLSQERHVPKSSKCFHACPSLQVAPRTCPWDVGPDALRKMQTSLSRSARTRPYTSSCEDTLCTSTCTSRQRGRPDRPRGRPRLAAGVRNVGQDESGTWRLAWVPASTKLGPFS